MNTKQLGRIFIFCLGMSLAIQPIQAQEEEEETIQECGATDNKKAIKLYEQGTDKKKYDKNQRVAFLKEAVDEDPNYAAALFMLSYERAKTAMVDGKTLEPCIDNFERLVMLCPDYHSAPYYYLGYYYLSKKQYAEAAKYYKLFLNFKSDDESKFDRNYTKYFEEARLDYEFAQFFASQFANPVPFNPTLVNDVSTANGEYLPFITPDNEYMFFTRRSEKIVKVRDTYISPDKLDYIERFTRAKRLNPNENQFEAGESMPLPFNDDDKNNYGGVTISLDNRHILLTICKPLLNGYINCDIFQSDYVYGFNETEKKEMWYWTVPKNLGPNVNNQDSWEAQPSLSGDGQTLFFASIREDSKLQDIYMSKLQADGTWGKAERLPEPINTEESEKTPFIHTDSQTLYFASNGHLGHGGYDVFYTKLGADGKWTKPINIGHPINTANDEHGFVVTTDGKDVFFASDNLGTTKKNLDIYTFQLYKEARPQKVLFVKGNLENTGSSLANATVELKNAVTNEVQTIKVDENDGNFAAVIKVKKDEDIIMNVKGDDIAFNSRVIKTANAPDTLVANFTKEPKETVAQVETPKATPPTPTTSNPSAAPKQAEVVDIFENDGGVYYTEAVEVKTAKVGGAYALNNISYGSNSAELTEDSKLMLNEFVLYLKEHPTLKISIQGHTDNVGNSAANLTLSTDRAFSVMAYLQAQGIAKNRLSFKGFGDQKPIESNATPEGRARNRRTEFLIVSK